MIYTPKYFSAKDKEFEKKFIRENSFATMISAKESEISHISKIPLLLKVSSTEETLTGHLAKANPHGIYLKENPMVTIIFDGPHEYISPMWYKNSKISVPTWNYGSVILTGMVHIIESSDWLIGTLKEMTQKFEGNDQWYKSSNKENLNNLSKGIIGLKVDIKQITSKFKLSQNKNPEDKKNIQERLKSSNPKLSNLMSHF